MNLLSDEISRCDIAGCTLEHNSYIKGFNTLILLCFLLLENYELISRDDYIFELGCGHFSRLFFDGVNF